MIFNVTSGGGSGLNLKVVGGTTQPENPRENTIWINTDTAITGYVLSPTQPETVAEGVVWLKTADEGVEINVGKKNAVLLHLASATMIIGSIIQRVDGDVYANGKWTSFSRKSLTLYNAGDECVDVTGGFGIDGFTVSYTSGKISLQLPKKNSDNMYFESISGSSRLTKAAISQNRIDLSGFASLKVDLKLLAGSKTYKNYMKIGVFVDNDLFIPDDFLAYTSSNYDDLNKNVTYYIDISQINVAAYVGLIGGYINTSGHSAEIYKLELV